MEKQIVTCLGCRAQLRIPSDKHIRFECPHCKKEYYAINGMLINKPGDDEMKKQNPEKMKTKKTVKTFAAIAAVVVIVVFSIRFWHDYRDYQIFDKSKDIKDYYSYKENHPHGLYMAKAGLLKNNIWDKMIARYDSISSTGERDEKSADFFRTMLYFMKENDVNNIYVKFDSTTVLTNFCDYPDSIKSECLKCYSRTYPHIYDYSPPNDSNTINIREHFTSGKLEQLQEIIFEGLTITFQTVFGSDFISLKSIEKENADAKVIIEIKYLISDAYRKGYESMVPRILPYAINNVFQNNVPGVSIEFKGSKISIPSSKKSYEFGSKEDFEHKVFEVEDIYDAYGQLTRSCFKSFVEKFSTQFGLFNYDKFNKKASVMVYNMFLQYGLIKEPSLQTNSKNAMAEKENIAAKKLEEVRNSRNLFVDPQKLEEDSLALSQLLINKK